MFKRTLTFNLIYSRCLYSVLSVLSRVYLSLGFLKILKQFTAYALSALNEISVSELTFSSKFMTLYFFFWTDHVRHVQRQTNITADFSPVCWGNWSLLPKTIRFKRLELGARVLENLLLDLHIRHLLLQNVKQASPVTSAASCGLCADFLFCPYALVCASALLLTVSVF